METLLLVILAIITGFMGRRAISNARVRNVSKSNDAVDAKAGKTLAENSIKHKEAKDEIKKSSSAIDSASESKLASEFDSAFGSVQVVDPFELRDDD